MIQCENTAEDRDFIRQRLHRHYCFHSLKFATTMYSILNSTVLKRTERFHLNCLIMVVSTDSKVKKPIAFPFSKNCGTY